MNRRIAICSLAVSAAFAGMTPSGASAAAFGGMNPLGELAAPPASSAPSSPSVSFAQPKVNGTLTGVLKDSKACEVTGSGFNKVVFHLDGQQLNTEVGAPWHCSFDTKLFGNGPHKLKATAYNAAGAFSVAEVNVNINSGGNTGGGTTTPPSSNGLTITSPAANATLKGTVNACAASAPSGTSYVRFYRDGVWLNTDTGSPYTCNLDVSKLTNGTHKLKAVSYSSSNATTAQTEISFNVGSGGSQPPQNQPPTVSLTAPAANAELSKTANCAADASDDGSVSKVEFLVGSKVVGTSTAKPYTCSFDTKQFGNGTHTLMARATDNQNATSTTQRSVTIKNDVVPDPGNGGGASPIAAADIMGEVQAEIPFAQQKGYNTQVLSQYINAAQIPETGMHASVLKNGETLRFGKQIDPTNSARKVLAFQVDPGDVTTSGAKRAELKFGNNLEMDTIYWVALSVYVYDWGALSDKDDALFGLQQHNGSPADLSPNFALYTNGTGRTFEVQARGSTSTSPSYGNTVSHKYASQPIPFGRWIDFVMKFKLNTSGNGFLQVWMDGTQIVDHKGLLGYITPGNKDFFKFGYYNWSGSSFASTRKVLLRSPVIVSDPPGTKYKLEDLRAYVNAH